MQVGAANPITSFSTPLSSLASSVCQASRQLSKLFAVEGSQREEGRGKEERRGARHLPELLLLDESRRSCEALQRLPRLADRGKHTAALCTDFTSLSRGWCCDHHPLRPTTQIEGVTKGVGGRAAKYALESILGGCAVGLCDAWHGLQDTAVDARRVVVNNQDGEAVSSQQHHPQTRASHARPA